MLRRESEARNITTTVANFNFFPQQLSEKGLISSKQAQVFLHHIKQLLDMSYAVLNL